MCVSLSVLWFPTLLNAQIWINMSGFAIDSLSGEKLIAATLIDTLSGNATITNNNGFYSLRVESGRQVLRVSHVGYPVSFLSLAFNSDTTFDIGMSAGNTLEVVTITGADPHRINSQEMPGLKTMPVAMLKNTPAIMGECDVLRAAQMIPGVQSGSEANTGLYVRGGEGDQNLILIDGVEVFNPNHLFGFFSVFNDDAVKSVKIHTYGFPAKYNGRLSSVLDIRTKDGDSRQFHLNATIGLISSKLQVQGPLIKDKLTGVFSYRRTYLGFLAKPIVKHFTEYSDADYYFQDINARIRWKVSPKNTLTISQYYGSDHGYFHKQHLYGHNPPNRDSAEIFADYRNRRTVDWGNNLLIARWESILSRKLFCNVSASASSYRYKGKDVNTQFTKYWLFDSLYVLDDRYELTTETSVESYTAQADFDYYLSARQQISLGGGYSYRLMFPRVTSGSTDSEGHQSRDKYTVRNPFAYIQDEITLFKRLHLIPGLHYSAYSCNGFDVSNLLPRLTMSYIVSARTSVHGSYTRMEQYLNLLTLSRISLASDLWLPAQKGFAPARSNDMSLGMSYSGKIYSFGADAFTRRFSNLMAYREGVSYFQDEIPFAQRVTGGSGKSYGMEVYVEKISGRLTGMISYTWSRSLRHFDDLNEGKEFPAQYDRPHNLRFNLSYSINPVWTISAVAQIMSGALQTTATKNYVLCFEYDHGYGQTGRSDLLLYRKNALRMPLYHRLDIAASCKKKHKGYTGTLNFGLYNAYNAQNAYEMQVKTISNPIFTERVLEKKVLFPILPFVSYSIEF